MTKTKNKKKKYFFTPPFCFLKAKPNDSVYKSLFYFPVFCDCFTFLPVPPPFFFFFFFLLWPPETNYHVWFLNKSYFRDVRIGKKKKIFFYFFVLNKNNVLVYIYFRLRTTAVAQKTQWRGKATQSPRVKKKKKNFSFSPTLPGYISRQDINDPCTP